jgi:transmembrane sensor
VSETGRENGVAAEAAEWLARRDRGPWSEADQTALDAWIAQSWAHATAFWRLDAAWGRANRLGAMRRAPGNRLLQAVSGRFTPMLFRAAAAAIVIAAVGAAAFYATQPGERSYETTVGGHETLTLGDGTKVELNTDTKVRVSQDRRKVLLDRGEAYFDVVHDAARPFMVMVGDHRVTDIGTKFLVRQNASRVEVSLFEGRAKLDSTSEWAPKRSAMLVPGDVAVATANSMSVMKKPEKALTSELGWRRGVLIFKHASLAEAAAEFNRYNRRKLVVEDTAAARLTIDGTFQADNIEDFTRLAQLVLGVRTENRGSEIAIMR